MGFFHAPPPPPSTPTTPSFRPPEDRSSDSGRLARHVCLQALAARVGAVPLPLAHSLLRQCCEALVAARLAQGGTAAELQATAAKLRDALARCVSLEAVRHLHLSVL
jgi:hypothetical protein